MALLTMMERRVVDNKYLRQLRFRDFCQGKIPLNNVQRLSEAQDLEF